MFCYNLFAESACEINAESYTADSESEDVEGVSLRNVAVKLDCSAFLGNEIAQCCS